MLKRCFSSLRTISQYIFNWFLFAFMVKSSGIPCIANLIGSSQRSAASFKYSLFQVAVDSVVKKGKHFFCYFAVDLVTIPESNTLDVSTYKYINFYRILN